LVDERFEKGSWYWGPEGLGVVVDHLLVDCQDELPI
jgi:hypothetical protein